MRNANLVVNASIFMASLATSALAVTPNTPLMGWASWNRFALNITADLIKAQADAMVSSGLSAAGYKYINIDDGFFNGRVNGTLQIDATKFPGGFKPVVDYIHSKGLKAGFYTDAGANTCGNLYGPETGGAGAGIYGYDQADIDLAFKTWGFDYIKVDYCGGRQTGLDEQTRYTAIRNAIDATGRTDIVYNICRWQFPGGWVASVGNSWRIADDIGNDWSSLTRILDTNLYLSGFSSPGHYNDMDMLEVGNGMSADEDNSQFALWCVLSSPLALGNDMANMSSSTKNLLTNTEALAINQDTTGLQATLLSDDGNGGQVWGRRLHGFSSKERTVVLFNRSSGTKTISVSWADLDLDGSATVRDLLNHKDLGSFTSTFSSSVPSHGAVFVTITGSSSKLQEVFEAENSWMNNFKLTKNVSIVANQAAPSLQAGCSRGAKVGYIGNSAANHIEFRNVYANADGGYRLTLRFLCGEIRSVTMTVNGKDTLLSNLNSGSFTKVDSITVPIALKVGKNTIRFSNTTAWTPDIDAIRVNVNSIATSILPAAPGRAANLNLRLLQADGILDLQSDAPIRSVLVYDRSGALVGRSEGSSISIRNLRSGTYSLKAISSEGFEIRSFAKI